MVLIQILLPVAAGPRGGDSKEAFADTRRELVEAFDGVTAYLRAAAQGVWTAPDGHEERDEVVMIEVVTEKFDRGWWRAYAVRLADRFEQQTIHVRALPIEMPTDEDV